MKLAINGFGRIGRVLTRILLQSKKYSKLDLVAINTLAKFDDCLHLLRHDSVFGNFEVHGNNNSIVRNNKEDIKFSRFSNVSEIEWSGLDFVLECSGRFKNRTDLSQFLKKTKRILLSSPSNDDTIPIFIYGVSKICDFNIASTGSCTTNCVVPLVYILNNEFGIKSGSITTIHAITNDQNLVDASHNDLYRARSAFTSIIPTSTGAAMSVINVLPELAGKLNISAVRVPVINGSLIDGVFCLDKNFTVDEIKSMIKDYSKTMDPVLGYTSEQLVSVDIIGDSNSCKVDLLGICKIGNDMIRIPAWYDNEFAFACRMLDICLEIQAQ